MTEEHCNRRINRHNMSIFDTYKTFLDMKIGLLLYPGCMPSGLIAFTELLTATNLRLGKSLFEFVWISQGGNPVESNGLRFDTNSLDHSEFDALLIPGSWRDRESLSNPKDVALISSLKELAPNIKIWSYCTGVYLAAAAGKLAQQEATTTWWMREIVSAEFPDIQWRLSQTCLFKDTVATASGVNGYQPIALALIEKLAGEAIVSDIQKFMVLPRPIAIHTPFQEVVGLVHRSNLLRDVVRWVEKTPAEKLNADNLAIALHLTPRTLSRKLQAQSGHTTGKLMRLIKLNQASDRLMTTNQPISVISHGLGFLDDTVLRRSFKQVAGMTPGEYRRRFGQ